MINRPPTHPRASAAKIICAVIQQQKSLDTLFEPWNEHKELSFIKGLCFGSLRWYFRLNVIAEHLLHKALPSKYFEVHCLLVIGLYQLIYLKTASHAAVSETVSAAEALKKPWAKALLNKTLRLFLRDQQNFLERADQSSEGLYAHPSWLIDRLKHDWPTQWLQILDQNNQRAPMTLRIHQQKTSSNDYLQQLTVQGITAQALTVSPEAIQLKEAVPVNKLPGFAQGLCSVQDLAGQLVAHIIQPQPSERILDACAAPGSKTLHLLEQQPQLKKLLALDKHPDRLQRLRENAERLQLNSATLEMKVADATQPEDWWDGQRFDCILLDAPCSGTGVIRRHPDIKLLRHPTDVAEHAALQSKLLEALWPLLKEGGRLLYSTCSVLPEENDEQIGRFLAKHSDAKPVTLSLPLGLQQRHGVQVLPGDQNADGFYYALLLKQLARP